MHNRTPKQLQERTLLDQKEVQDTEWSWWRQTATLCKQKKICRKDKKTLHSSDNKSIQEGHKVKQKKAHAANLF